MSDTNPPNKHEFLVPPDVERVEWERTDRPLTVAILGWATLAAQAMEGSGYNLVASQLASGLVQRGHKVVYLRSGMDYGLRPGPHVRPMGHWRGVECSTVFNSRNLAPGSANFENMERELSDPATTRVVLEWLDQTGAQIVHAHSIEGFGLDVVGAIRDSGRPVVVTPHNYWFVCPQVDLLHEEKRICLDYDGGRRCEGCLTPGGPAAAREGRRIEQTIRRRAGNFAAGMAGHTMRSIRRRLGRLEDPFVLTDADQMDPDAESALGYDVADADSHSGQIDHGFGYRKPDTPVDLGRSDWDTNERFLSKGSDVHLQVLDDSVYGRRRLAGLKLLERSSLVTPPSAFMLRTYLEMGLPVERGRWLRLGLQHFDQLNRRARRSPFYDARPWDPATATRPLRFAFHGTVRNNKGFEILARAIPMLDKEIRQRCHFVVRAGGWDWPFRKRLSRFPEVSFLGGYDPLHLLSSPGEYDVGVLTHVWFENSPLVLLEHLHAGKFVISSRLGGVPDWLHEPAPGSKGNGLMFPGGDPDALAERIRSLVTGEVTVPSPREIHDETTLVSYPHFVRESESIYNDLLDGTDAHRTLTDADAAPGRSPAPQPA